MLLKGPVWSLAVKPQEWRRGMDCTCGLTGVKAASEAERTVLVALLKGVHVWSWGKGHRNDLKKIKNKKAVQCEAREAHPV